MLALVCASRRPFLAPVTPAPRLDTVTFIIITPATPPPVVCAHLSHPLSFALSDASLNFALPCPRLPAFPVPCTAMTTEHYSGKRLEGSFAANPRVVKLGAHCEPMALRTESAVEALVDAQYPRLNGIVN